MSDEKDLKLISKILETNDFVTPMNMGLTKEMLEGPGRKVFDFIAEYFERYRSLPTPRTIGELLSETKIELHIAAEPLEFLVDEIIDRSVHQSNLEFIQSFETLVKTMPPRKVLMEAGSVLNKSSGILSRNMNVVNAGDLVDKLFRDYDKSSQGLAGIKTPWPKMDVATNGWSDGDLTFIVARSGHGKTWCVINIAEAAALDGKKVLIFSGEMSEVDMAKRHVALRVKLPYGPFRKGKLDQANKEKMEIGFEKYRGEKNVIIVDASGGMTTANMEAVIMNVRPDLVIVDAFYRIKSSGKAKDRFENLALSVGECKGIAGRCKVPIIGSTQLNRDSTKKKEIGTEDLAMTDVLAWEATNIFAMRQTDDDKENFRMSITPIKIREGENLGKDISIHWDFYGMNFDEVGDFEDTATKAAKNWIDDF